MKRVMYTALGAGAGTAISYPDQAKQLSNDAYVETRKKALIAYTFVSGGQVINVFVLEGGTCVYLVSKCLF